ncbi:hypothetical protein PDESU_04211 [Pontiella desulfatans]|uniref:Uncharacterized protein n=1 Tax=Pontiella desulfatans TaxID=2750659 RepID=A0A6C2U893_PONDE|nr:hypothetical protein [Pontiella desulfatans]VGO15626.1 hypothetical protein PDESU_04211 [Pontiella desulfatans]
MNRKTAIVILSGLTLLLAGCNDDGGEPQMNYTKPADVSGSWSGWEYHYDKNLELTMDLDQNGNSVSGYEEKASSLYGMPNLDWDLTGSYDPGTGILTLTRLSSSIDYDPIQYRFIDENTMESFEPSHIEQRLTR